MEYNVRDVIEYSIKIEKESYLFYARAADVVVEKDVKKLLTQLASEEVDHQNHLRILIDENRVTVEELETKLDLDSNLLEKIVETSEIKPNSYLLEILSIALEREEYTENVYAMLSTLSNINEDVIAVFTDLRLQEKGHVRKIQARIDKLDR